MQAVLGVAEAAGKPLVVDEFNIQRPIRHRNEGLQLIYGMLQNSSSSVAGTPPPAPASAHTHTPTLETDF